VKLSQQLLVVWIGVGIASALPGRLPADEVDIQVVVDLLAESDKEFRAVAFDQIRNAFPGAATTKQFAALLPTLPAETQVGFLSALADRGDQVAAPAVRALLGSSTDDSVRVAAVKALGSLGDASDLPALYPLALGSAESVRQAARRSLVVLPGTEPSAAMAEMLSDADAALGVLLIETLTERRARETVPSILAVAVGDDPEVREAAMQALAGLATESDVAGMVQGVLKAEPGGERAAAERAVMRVCQKDDPEADAAKPLLEALDGLTSQQRLVLLPTVGRVGGPAALRVIEEAVRSDDAAQQAAGFKALFNWPDASIAFRLLELARTESQPQRRREALRALIRVAPLPGEESEQFRLDLLRTAMAMCEHDEDRLRVIERAKAVRAIETLRYVARYFDEPAFREKACLTVVELAHQSGLRESHRDEFHQALDRVIAISQDATVIDRAKRYKKGETWVRPKSS